MIICVMHAITGGQRVLWFAYSQWEGVLQYAAPIWEVG
jgi:hypothetical protein